jgi:hypothetical protein
MSASNQEAVLMSALVCHLDAQLISIERLAALLGLVVFPRNNPIRTWKPIASCPSEFSVKMQSENAIADFLLEWEEIPRCSAENTEPPEVPPPPPRRDLPPPLNPSEPFDGEISDAYDGSTDSGQTYNPDPDGGVPDFPIGDVCVRYRIVVLYWLDGESLSSPGTQTSGTFYAPIDDVILSSFNGDPTNSVVVRSRGDASFEQCGDGLVERPLVLNNVQKFTIVDISEVV